MQHGQPVTTCCALKPLLPLNPPHPTHSQSRHPLRNSVITYSALISACEKAGQWEAALDLFGKMKAEGCTPNVITYNSLITACGQGAQWQQAADVFNQMQRGGCRPDVVTYTALISAYERGGEWLRALETFRLVGLALALGGWWWGVCCAVVCCLVGRDNGRERERWRMCWLTNRSAPPTPALASTKQMQDKGCMPDSILYAALLEALWDTGVSWAQAKAARLFHQASKQGHFRKLPDLAGPKCELALQQLSPGMAMLALHCWLADVR
jgi:pentatricopeptide repeat domain-containing protein 1